MTVFIHGLYVDLRNRLQKMIVPLETPDTPSATAANFKKNAIEILQTLSQRIEVVIESGILNSPKFLKNAVIKYNSINNQFLLFERYRFLALIRWSEKAEGFFETVVKKIFDEIGALLEPPFITTMSNSHAYFWAYPDYNMIALPIGEEEHLLNLSDLYHEIGHLAYHEYPRSLLRNHIDYLENFYNESELFLKFKGQVTNVPESVEKTLQLWSSTWNEEFFCDLFATYLVGPAYAWTNMKICTLSSSSNNVYSYIDMEREHPPDEARMRAIFKMLELIGMEKEAEPIQKAWKDFLEGTKNQKPMYYDTFFSQKLIDSIATDALQDFQRLLFNSYPEQLKTAGENKAISKSINEAWAKMRNDPDNFEIWEREELKEIVKSKQISEKK